MSSVETDSDVYKTLLESTRAIPWRIDWKTMTFSYIGPQIEELLSVSLGVGTTGASLHATALEFVEQVDHLLYKARHNGRMRAEFADFRD
ncbi:PleD family two-component response regulator [Pseudomonas synxantha]|uniref:PleD family two-component response regulator n=1 Tax=Pseudomonas synxantha TaxID=47883 RepID=A0ACC6JVZ4_9PSED|nr:PleD family two-component response regulator [Pseudomonas synxantha]